MYYTYVLRCCDGDLYVGSALDLRKRLAQHRAGPVRATAHRLPIILYYEACRSELKARLREKQLKSGFGRAYLNRRLEDKSHHARNASRSDAGGGSNPASRTSKVHLVYHTHHNT
jgi:putative endonuclease